LYYCHNSLYTSQAVLQSQPNQSYSVSERYLYDPYGKITVLDAQGVPKTVPTYSALGNGYTYTGRFLDGETGLYYFRYRYYDPSLGRFSSHDPLGIRKNDINFYRADFSLAMKVDPFGLTSSEIKGNKYGDWLFSYEKSNEGKLPYSFRRK
jgi:RHS repeat-associated protein